MWRRCASGACHRPARSRRRQHASEQDILRTIFAAGFSTREQVSEVSGRGIGLNIVLDVVENVGGKVDVRSELGRGTTFDIEVPITVAITRVVLFRVGMGSYALPAASVRSLVLASTMEHSDGPDGPSIQFAGAAVPVLDLGKVLDEPPTPGEMHASSSRKVARISWPDRDHFAPRTRGHAQTHGQVLRETLAGGGGREPGRRRAGAGAQGRRVGAAGATRAPSKRRPSADLEVRQAAGRVALVADDSPVVRDIIAQALRSYGLHVLVAGDGEEALALFAAHARVDIVVTDIDMPRLDGLGLVRALRSREGSKDVPVVAISMRGSDLERRAAMEAGMSAYIDKSDFNQALLWQTIRPFVAGS
jgi:CheY-like chemotaxis protein